MARVIAGMTVSLDGFVADANGSAGALYPDLAELQDAPYMKAMQDETGAALMGRRTFEMAEDPDAYADSYELQVPIFVVTHTPPSVAPTSPVSCSRPASSTSCASTSCRSCSAPACGCSTEPARLP